MLSQLTPLEMEADYKLQAVLLLACPENEYSLLLEHVSIPLIIIGMKEKLEKVANLTDAKVLIYIKYLLFHCL